MKKFILISLLIISTLNMSTAQTEFGLEIGQHQSVLISEPSGLALDSYSERTIGAKIGLFLERDISPSLGIRFNLSYNLRHFDLQLIDFFAFHSYHTLCFPIKVIFKAGKIVHFGLGVEPMLLLPLKNHSNNSLIHIGPCGEIAFRIKKKMRLSFYCHYDLVKVKDDKYGAFNNLTIGASFAFVFKKFKKRRVIYGPG